MKKVIILGSCVSRDIFRFCNQEEFKIVDYYARTSLASLATEPALDKEILRNIASPFQRRVVWYDMEKTFWKIFDNVEFDILLIDFIDDRFNFYKMKENAIVTISNEFRKAIGALDRQKIISNVSNEYRIFWQKGLNMLQEKASLLKARIILNKAYYANGVRGGGANCLSISKGKKK